MDDDEVRAALEERYGVQATAATRRRRWFLLAALGIVTVVAFVWLAVVSTDEAVRTEDVAFRVVDDGAVEVTFVAYLDEDVTAECTVVALNDVFAQVGVAHVDVDPPTDGATVVTARVATTEPATGARIPGCREVPPRGE